MKTEKKNSARLFLAVFPDDTVKSILDKETALLQKKYTLPGLKWTAPAQRHLTLKFLGDVTPGEKERLIQRLDALCPRLGRPRLSPKAYAFFPNRRRARVFYLGLEEDAALSALAREIEVCAGESVPGASSAPFRPHITLARMGRRFSGYAALTPLSRETARPWRQDVDSFMLVESRLSASGAKYTPVHTFFLPETK
ncbi:MAG TPA: RNA 2',3'-cyclic phosphodiesterase [Caldithrix abyssi]|uniref:RNA 2',3'-cyclic phosphodiesterase n=1 Tax=Caldithrix abyssi TaxID=187145 RepID=A0A7V5RMT5_CALAY|nr:RNA 2',3'-cyclic phosphodiesterase [Caldithrix abyssi]